MQIDVDSECKHNQAASRSWTIVMVGWGVTLMAFIAFFIAAP